MRLSKIIFIVSAFILVFLIASLMGYYKMITYGSLLSNVIGSLETINLLIKEKPKLIRKAVYEEEGVTVKHQEKLQGNGFTAIQGWFSEGPQIKLINFDGELINNWDIDFFKIWPSPAHIKNPKIIPKTRFNFHSQGMHLYPDGSLLASIQGLGTVKMDACGEILWTLDELTHHTIEVDEEGFIWVPITGENANIDEAYIYDDIEKRLNLKKHQGYGFDQVILKVNPDGKIVQRISLLEGLVNASVEDRFYDAIYINPSVPIHINDIEIVTEELASKLNGVRQGNLLVSYRQMHMLAILDEITGEILWYKIGPWVRQHDPEIQPDGSITVYNNRSSSLVMDGEKPFSNILKYDPETDEIGYHYPKEANKYGFFSDIMGTHQILANGNTLISETRTGRVFEVDSSDEVVWEYIERYKETYAALIESVERYPDDDFMSVEWSTCNE